MDDFGALAMLMRGSDPENSELGRMRKAVQTRFAKLGVEPHKQFLCWGLPPSLGVTMAPHVTELQVIEEKWW